MHVLMIELENIYADNPSRPMDTAALEAMRVSVRAEGIKVPVTVTRVNWTKYRLAAGYIRHAACNAEGIKRIPCVVLDSPKMVKLRRCSDNLIRQELSVSERANATEEYARLIADDQGGLEGTRQPSTSAIAKALPGSGSLGAKRKRLVRAKSIAGLDKRVQRAAAERGLDSQSFLLELGKIEDVAEQFSLIDRRGSRSVPADDSFNKSLYQELENLFDEHLAAPWSRANTKVRGAILKMMRGHTASNELGKFDSVSAKPTNAKDW